MKKAFLAGVSACSILLPAQLLAQTVDPVSRSQGGGLPPSGTDEGAQSSTTADNASGDIVVTANRRAERLTDVPATVTAVTANEVFNLKLFRTEDIAPLSPGLQLSRPSTGFNGNATIRGVENIEGGALPTVDFYINDVPQDANYALNAIYDVGQIEVLRGPQGTLRGRLSPAGAITITTRRPDLNEFGGFAQFTGTNQGGINGQAAVSVPLIADRLSIRLAGLVDDGEGNRVRSVNTGRDPNFRTWSGRVSVLAVPVDELQLAATYQHIDVNNRFFPQVVGAGSPGLPASGAQVAVLAGFNGPVLTAGDRRSVVELPAEVSQNGDVVTLQATLELPFDADLIYVGGYQSQKTIAGIPIDIGNAVRNYDRLAVSGGPQSFWNHEVRLQSSGGRLFDYVLGGFYERTKSLTNFQSPSLLFGAFGVTNPTVGPIDPDFLLNVTGNFRATRITKAVFGSVTFHATDRLDLTGGLRYSDIDLTQQGVQNPASARIALSKAALGIPSFVPCTAVPNAGFQNSRFGTAFCERPIPFAGGISPTPPRSPKQQFDPLTYNVSAKYKITDDINVYASHGRSFRPGAQNAAALQNQLNPVLQNLVYLPPETSRSYETV